MAVFSALNVLQSTANDIGRLINDKLSPSEVTQAIGRLLPGEKYAFLKHHAVPSQSHIFPRSYLSGRNRCFQRSWLSEHPWMVYSEVLDGVFCIACAIFCTNPENKHQLVNHPFRKWHKRSEKCKIHEQCQYHQEAMQLADAFIMSVEKPDTSLPVLINTRKADNIHRNRSILKIVADAILYCARQYIALRGDHEKLDHPGNAGNFISLLKLLAKHNETLNTHMKAPEMRCVTYMSPQIQNELLDVMGKHIVLHDIVQDIKEAKLCSICADEVTSHNTEELAICVRFVDAQSNIREEFLTFVKLTRLTGETIAHEILSTLEELQIPVKNMRGQGYDGASNMSSVRVGVQARIKEKSPLATYVHCSGHCLNLVISHSCALPEVRNMLD